MNSALKLRHRMFMFLLILAGGLLFAGRVMAQGDETSKMVANLPPESRTVIERLGRPAGAARWRLEDA